MLSGTLLDVKKAPLGHLGGTSKMLSAGLRERQHHGASRMSERVEFAHILRGIAALAVVFAHFCGTFFIVHEGIASLIMAPPLPDLPSVGGAAKFVQDYTIVFGQFGVGVFFIISGFVIPFSLTATDKRRFLIRRFLRIFPVYAAGFSIVILSVWANSLFAQSSFDYSAAQIMSHYGILTRGLLGYERIDGISWTLEVELVFYVGVAIIGRKLIDNGTAPLFWATAAITATSIASSQLLQAGYYHVVGRTGFQLWGSLLLVVGLAYHSYWKRSISTMALISIKATIACALVVIWLLSDRNVYHWQWISGYLLACVIFATMFSLRDRITGSRVLSHFSDISYPLYVVHALFGYSLMYWTIKSGGGPYVAIGVALTAVYSASVIIHIFVEKPIMRYSQSRARPRPAIVAPAT